MALRATEADENRAMRVCYSEQGKAEVVTALEMSRPPGSLIRSARFEPISVRCPSGEEGR